MAKLEKPSAIDYLDEVTHRTHTHTEKHTHTHIHIYASIFSRV